MDNKTAPKRPASEPLIGTPILKALKQSQSDADHYLHIRKIIDEQMTKNSEILYQRIKVEISESEKRVVAAYELKLGVLTKQINDLTERVLMLETEKDRVTMLQREISVLKKESEKRENANVACDIRINGVPCIDGENIYNFYLKICQAVNINPPEIKSIYRLKNTRNGRNNIDSTIIVKFETPYSRNFFLRTISVFMRRNKEPLKLHILGFDSNVPFYINENLTSTNYNLFLHAVRMKKEKRLTSVYTMRGVVYIKLIGSDDSRNISSIDDLNVLLYPPSSTNNDEYHTNGVPKN